MKSFSRVANSLKKALNANQTISSDEKKQLVSERENASKLFQKLRSKDFIAEFKNNLHNMEIDSNKEMIEKTVNIITRQVKQMKIKNRIESISLEMETYECPFPPMVIITTDNDEIVLETDEVKPKELHYELEAISADFNLANENNVRVILETYENIITDLEQYDWKSICNTSNKFEVKFIKP